MANRFREAIEKGEFVVTCEMIPGRGAFEANQRHEYEVMKEIYATGRVDAISITDCPSGNPAISSMAIGRYFKAEGITSLVHFTCKDRSRNEMQGQMYEMQIEGLENLLVMSGDIQNTGFEGAAIQTFDLDPVNTLRLINAMNEGLIVHGRKGDTREIASNFFPGAVVNPFKYREGEIVPQYVKLEKKLIAGARYIITQVGYDARKMQELLFYTKERGYDVPMIANVFLATKPAANLMRNGAIAGCYVNDELMTTLEEESAINKEQKGYAREKRVERAAKMVAIARGLGYAGVHLGGFGMDAKTVVEILDEAERIGDDWRQWAKEISYGMPGGDYLYKPELDADGNPTGLNTHEHATMNEDITGRSLYKKYGLSRFFHHWVLTQEYNEDRTEVKHVRFNKILAKRMDSLEKRKGINREHGLEHMGKALLYGCIDCGDCGLEPVVYSCPMASCLKSQRNGPCGGSMDGYCEGYPPTGDQEPRFCVHYLAYHRLKKFNELEKYTSYITVPNDWRFWQHSAWSNYTHCRDNCSKRIPISVWFGGTPGGVTPEQRKAVIPDMKEEADGAPAPQDAPAPSPETK